MTISAIPNHPSARFAPTNPDRLAQATTGAFDPILSRSATPKPRAEPTRRAANSDPVTGTPEPLRSTEPTPERPVRPRGEALGQTAVKSPGTRGRAQGNATGGADRSGQHRDTQRVAPDAEPTDDAAAAVALSDVALDTGGDSSRLLSGLLGASGPVTQGDTQPFLNEKSAGQGNAAHEVAKDAPLAGALLVGGDQPPQSLAEVPVADDAAADATVLLSGREAESAGLLGRNPSDGDASQRTETPRQQTIGQHEAVARHEVATRDVSRDVSRASFMQASPPVDDLSEGAGGPNALMGGGSQAAGGGGVDDSDAHAQAQAGGHRLRLVPLAADPEAGGSSASFTTQLGRAVEVAQSPLVAGSGHTSVASVGDGPQAQPSPPASDTPQLDANTERVIRGMRGVMNQNGGAVTLRLSPPEMGIVRIEMQINGGAVSAQLHTELAEARTLLDQQLGQLRHALETHGLTVEKLAVQTMTQEGSAFTTQRDAEQSPDGRSRGHNTAGGQAGGGERDRDRDEGDLDRPDETFEGALNTVV